MFNEEDKITYLRDFNYTPDEEFVRLQENIITIDNSEITTKAMLDTGNFLKEPITNIPVVIVEHSLFKGIISNEILDNIENILGGDLKNLSIETKKKYMSKLKIIPFNSIGKSNGILLGLKADKIEIEEENT